MNSFVLSAILLVAVACQVFGQDQVYGFNEPACLRKGGMCIQRSECEGFVPGNGLCGSQTALGFECCYGLPKSEHRCSMRGGSCFKKNRCPSVYIYSDANDCSADEECCILTN